LLEAEFVVTTKDRDGVDGVDELCHWDLFVLSPVSLLVTVTLTLLLFGVEDLCFVVGSRVLELCEDVLRVEELRVNVLWSLVTAANNENFGGNISRRRRLGSLNGGEKLLENPQKGIVVLGAENFGDKASTLAQEISSQSQGLQNKFCLRESILYPSGTNVGSTIVENDVCLPVFDMPTNCCATLVCCDIALESDGPRNRLDRGKVDTDNKTLRRHVLGGDLTP
jgi:hypothetical protein